MVSSHSDVKRQHIPNALAQGPLAVPLNSEHSGICTKWINFVYLTEALAVCDTKWP